jgi:hypothetical protein
MRRRFVYQHRSPERWRRAATDGLNGEFIGDDAGWLAKVLNAASRSNRLADWDISFCLDLDARLARWGDKLILTDKQRAQVERIERKLERRGEL